jgi:hypothetical protein
VSEIVIRFYESIADVINIRETDLVGFFVYFLTEAEGKPAALRQEIEQCFRDCDLSVPKNTAVYLTRGLAAKPPKYVKAVPNGYRLHRQFRDEISGRLGKFRFKAATSHELRKLEMRVSEPQEKDFLSETITCFDAGAKRAAIIMCWVMTIEHLFGYIHTKKLVEFNAALAKSPDKKLNSVVTREDFGELKEVKFIEVCRAAGIITNDQRKILDTSLGVRNSCAHPSTVVVLESKVLATIEDLVLNIILKF